MVGGGNRKDDPIAINITNVFAALGSLKKKKKSVKDQGTSKKGGGSKKNHDKESKVEKEQVLWAPAPLYNNVIISSHTTFEQANSSLRTLGRIPVNNSESVAVADIDEDEPERGPTNPTAQVGPSGIHVSVAPVEDHDDDEEVDEDHHHNLVQVKMRHILWILRHHVVLYDGSDHSEDGSDGHNVQDVAAYRSLRMQASSPQRSQGRTSLIASELDNGTWTKVPQSDLELMWQRFQVN